MRADDRAPRALLHRTLISIAVTPSEHHRLVRSFEDDAMAVIEEGQDDFADYLLRRVAELRDAAR
jgi:hypothetical protein